MAERRPRSYAYQRRLARFPMPRDLDTFDFRESTVNETVCIRGTVDAGMLRAVLEELSRT